MGLLILQGRTVTLSRFFDTDQKQIEKLPIPNLAQNWAKFAFLIKGVYGSGRVTHPCIA
jgi:hypothetical protein